MNNSTIQIGNTTAPAFDAGGICTVANHRSAIQDCFFPALSTAVGGESLLGLLGAGLLYAVVYVASGGDTATPTVLLLGVGTVLIGLLPAQYVGIAYALVIVGLAAAVWRVVKVFVLEGL
jgi:hypothetical protein